MRKVALVALLLAGCGSGGGDEPVVSASPPPGEAPAPIVAAPPAVVPPVTAPPVVSPPKAPEPGSTPTGTPAPGAPTISGNVLALAIGQHFIPTETPLAIGKIQDVVNAPNSDVTHTQEQHFPLPTQTVGRYISRSMGWQSTFYATPATIALSLDWTPFGMGSAYGAELGAEMSINGEIMYRSGPLRIEPNAQIALDQTLAEWTDAPWFAKLIVQSGDDPKQFRLCWRTAAESTQSRRHSCGKFDRATGEHKGVYIVDDNVPIGRVTTWESE
jgi:hypothetical protein